MKRFLLLAAAAMILAPATPAAAQSASEPTWFTIFADHVATSNRADFEKATGEFMKAYSATKPDGISWITISSDDMGYLYVVPGSGPMDIEELDAAYSAGIEAGGAAVREAQAKTNALVESQDMYFILLRPDLSYEPGKVQITADRPYRHYTQLFVHPGMQRKFEASIAAWIDAYRKAGIERGWRIYQYVTGTDLPAYLVVTSAKNEADSYASDAEIQERLGDTLGKLRAGTGPTLRKVKETSGWVRPEFSYPAMSGGSN
jgi:hypothetical protein